ncbi:MAG: hypothetical protein NTZ38_02050 [Candidatus Taylorbacteria bacterium]|nr:hypothetical protein [Candidatus Taylorbacteria bacterium]
MLIALITVQSFPFTTHAIFGAADTVIVVAETSPTAIKRTTDTTMMQVKNYVLDGLAWSVAKIMLQQVTASVVNWINTGFKGNPAFLTNPQGFFMDVADQATGAFIANTGVLSELCSPFNIDIRLSLALNNNMQIDRYACTLSTVINNARNSTINVSENATVNRKTIVNNNISASAAKGVTVNGKQVVKNDVATINGFMGGDFKQGGWPAFIAMTTEPQNNIYGAYLTSRDDLAQQIANKKNSIKVDLSMGNGFMSWPKCEIVPVDEAVVYKGSGTLNEKVDSKGNVAYEKCETQTPGSVIAGSINKSLGIPQDTLNIAGSLNQIVGALFAQLVTKVLQGGLHTASGSGGSGSVTTGIATQLSAQSDSSQLSSSKSQMTSSINGYVSNATQYIALRQQLLNSLTAANSVSQNIGPCLNTVISQTQSGISLANSRHERELDDIHRFYRGRKCQE